MKTFNLILCLLFSLFALMQYNDPDPWIWIVLYAFVAIISGFAAQGRYNLPILIGGILISLIGLIILWPGFYDWIQRGMPTITGAMKAGSSHIELTREFLGLFLILLTLAFHLWQARSQNIKST